MNSSLCQVIYYFLPRENRTRRGSHKPEDYSPLKPIFFKNLTSFKEDNAIKATVQSGYTAKSSGEGGEEKESSVATIQNL